MCGRFALAASELCIKEYFGLSKGFLIKPRYNIAPYFAIPVIRGRDPQLDFFKWGLIPSWKRSGIHPIKGYINARVETLFEKPAFRKAILRQRCIIPATGYYEWMEIKDKKHPYYISIKPQSLDSSETPSLFGMAGIWDTWQDENGLRQDTCAIITTKANDAMSSISDRMPLVLSKAHHDIWLKDKMELIDLQMLLQSPSSIVYDTYPVSPRVNSPNFDAPQCLQSL